MRQDITQNINLPQENSLEPIKEEESLTKFNLPHNPKTIILLIFGLIIFFLLIAAIFVSKNNKNKIVPNQPAPEPSKTINTPTPANKLSQKINQIESDLNSGTLLEPPQLDNKIGL